MCEPGRSLVANSGLTIYKIGAKALAGLTGKLTSKGATLKAMQVLLSPTMLASVEGGIYSSAFDYQQQKFEIECELTFSIRKSQSEQMQGIFALNHKVKLVYQKTI